MCGSGWIKNERMQGQSRFIYIVLLFICCVLSMGREEVEILQSHPAACNVEKAGFTESDQNHLTHKFNKLCVVISS